MTHFDVWGTRTWNEVVERYRLPSLGARCELEGCGRYAEKSNGEGSRPGRTVPLLIARLHRFARTELQAAARRMELVMSG